MSKKDQRDQMRRELLFLLKGLDYYRQWRLSALSRAAPHIPEEELVRQVVMPGSFFLDLFDQAPGASCGGVLKEVRSIYSVTEGDLKQDARLSDEDAQDVAEFLKGFEAEMGCPFDKLAGFTGHLAHVVLQRGHIQSDEEYQFLRDLRDDGVQAGLDDDQLAAIDDLLQRFEDNARSA